MKKFCTISFFCIIVIKILQQYRVLKWGIRAREFGQIEEDVMLLSVNYGN